MYAHGVRALRTAQAPPLEPALAAVVRRGYVDTKEGQIHYYVVGPKDGMPLILIHENPESGAQVRPTLGRDWSGSIRGRPRSRSARARPGRAQAWNGSTDTQ